MIICGVKLSHDGGIAVIEDDKLIFSTEIEKLENSRRYSSVDDLNQIELALSREGISLENIDHFVVDGWYSLRKSGNSYSWGDDRDAAISATQNGSDVRVRVAPYTSDHMPRGALQRYWFEEFSEGPFSNGYSSYSHASNHVLGTYCTSPFAQSGESALVLAWDGGLQPRLYKVDYSPFDVAYLGPLFAMPGNVFTHLCMALDPFRRAGGTKPRLLEVPGKAMAYAALGEVQSDAYARLREILDKYCDPSFGMFDQESLAGELEVSFGGLSSADLIATMQEYIGELLVDSLEAAFTRHGLSGSQNFCFTGGCALNIKWNSTLRRSGLFTEVWVPPFPNDSGAAIGTACCEMISINSGPALDWNVYSGPKVTASAPLPGWRVHECGPDGVASILHEEGEPVVVIDGRAELGPRALGNRSILAPAVAGSMKDRLNGMKGREDYRPVAPICLEDRVGEIFSPGGEDPYMLFDHRVRSAWAGRIPAIIHLDGSARLQSVRVEDSSVVASAAILSRYAQLSGIPVLCNTSANFSGCGFFPDAASAMKWGETKFVWSEGKMYSRP